MYTVPEARSCTYNRVPGISSPPLVVLAMPLLFWRQFKALFYKNVIVFRNHWLANLLRCLIFPLAYGVFLGYVTTFFAKPNNYGIGAPTAVFRVGDHFDGSSPIVWVDNTNGTGYVQATAIMGRVTAGFSQKQLNGVKKVNSNQELFDKCVSNANGASGCFIALTFDAIPPSAMDTRAINYTIRSDSGAYHVDVVKHTSSIETKVLPMQWAVDQAIIELTTGKQTPLPLQFPFTKQLNSDTDQDNRLFFLSIVGSFGGVAFFLAFSGIVYQVSGGIAMERAMYLTSHMQAMGALDSARIMSWFFSVSLLYLPAWVLLAIIWWSRLFTGTNIGYLILLHLITGLGCAGWSFFISVPFSKSPQLAAVVTTGAAIVLSVIPMMLTGEGNPALGPVLSFFFPSMFYTLMLKNFAGFETSLEPTSLSQMDPSYFFTANSMIAAAIVGLFFWPCCAVYLERWMYGISNPSNTGFWFWSTKNSAIEIPSNISITLQNVRKVFNTSFFRRKSRDVVAIADLTIDIPSYGIFVLLGPNGAGKSTSLSILGGLTKATSGTVSFSGNTTRPPRGTLGLVPQKNVLFPELSCLQTLHVWNAIKHEDGGYSDSDIERLLHDCDLQSKMHDPAGTLSGGQKRKLQLAIGLVGGSKVVLVDECTSGVDPLSRRALWKALTTYRSERTIILTTHFLDEADFLADRIAVLAAPGKLIASDTPVALKSQMGEGYSVLVKFGPKQNAEELLTLLQTVAPNTALEQYDPNTSSYHFKSKDTRVIAASLRLLEDRKAEFDILGYDVLGTTIEEIFLDLLNKEENEDKEHTGPNEAKEETHHANLSEVSLSNGRSRSSWAQARTIFYKRSLIFRRSWLALFLALAVGISGAWWPIRFVKGGVTSCAHRNIDPLSVYSYPLYPPTFWNNSILAGPLSLESTLNGSLPEVFFDHYSYYSDPTSTSPQMFDPFIPIADKDTFIQTVKENFTTNLQGGLYLDFDKNDYVIAYQLDIYNLAMFSVASNLFFNRGLNSTTNPSGSKRIIASFSEFPTIATESLATLQWLAIFGAAMAVFPAFFTLYVAKERHSSVQAMQLSNGLANPLGLWLGHVLFDSMFTVVVATVIAIIYSAVKNKFQGIGLLWLVMCLYGFASTLLAYIAAIVIKSPLGAFAVLVVSQFIIYLLYLTGYIVTLFSALPLEAPHIMNIFHFTMALIAPINSLTRAALVSVNQFSLLCDGEKVASGPALVAITRYGGPILYLVLWIIILLFVLSLVDTGLWLTLSPTYRRNSPAPLPTEKMGNAGKPLNLDVLAEAQKAFSSSNSDPLRMLNVSKSFGKNKVVDNVTFTIPHRSLFVMLGPNGAGKTTTFDMIHGHLTPDEGDVLVNNTSVLLNVKKARVSFGVCPQFTAMDAHLTVREHLVIYGQLRGLSNEELERNLMSIMQATGLDVYSSRLATKLSGGNQRKLALAIALIGNPSVVLVDEYSTGIDARMKRELWAVLKQVTKDKSVFSTTHSMEEASYLATKVGIMSKRMLAVGTPDELETRTASYEVHFSCHSRQDLVKVQTVMAKIPGARMVDDVATRFEVPIVCSSEDEEFDSQISVASIFEILSKETDFPEFTIGKSSLETAFIRIINEDMSRDYGREEDTQDNIRPSKRLWGLC